MASGVLSNKAKKQLSDMGIPAEKVARARKRNRRGFPAGGRSKNRGYTVRDDS